MILLTIFALFLGYNAYTMVEGFKGEGVTVDDDPSVNTETNTISFWIELTNDGLIPITLDISVDFTDLRQNSKYIGTAEETFEIGGQSTVKKTLVMTVPQEFMDYAKSQDGLYIEIEPSVTGTYAGFIPIPETALETQKTTIHSS